MPNGLCKAQGHSLCDYKEVQPIYAPVFYLNPVLPPLLDVLFPERNPFHLLSRFLLAPSDAMWGSISSHLDIHSSRRIGVQVRELKTRRYMSEYDENVLHCIKRKGGFLLKRLRKRIPPEEYPAIYVATLVGRHLEEMNSSMRVLMEETGKEFRLNFQKLDGREVHGMKHQAEALVDMWMLNKRAGKGYFIGLGVEPCFHAAPKRLSCVQEEPVAFSLQDMANRTSKLKVCVDRESDWTVVPRRSSLFQASEN
ncbi:putative fucosyltransferase 10 [Nymphaea colorata]|nr:putative fucosyltransferase 10 [Nymphaea colorata]